MNERASKRREKGTWWISTNKFTVKVVLFQSLIDPQRSAPLIGVFGGQPLVNLRRWAERFGGYAEQCLSADTERNDHLTETVE